MAEKPSDLYFVGPWTDAFCMGLGSILCFLFYRYGFPARGQARVDESAILLSSALAWIVNWPHFSATAWALYESSAKTRLFPVTAYLVPLVVLLATVTCFIYPVSFAPSFVKLYLLWSPWHYSLQAFGITLIYARRARLEISPLAKRALATFFISSFLVWAAEMESSLSIGFVYAIYYPQLNVPAFLTTAMSLVMYGSLAVAAWGLLPGFRRGTPWIVALPVVTQYLWFVHGTKSFSFQLLVPLFHCLQYLLVAWATEMHGRAKGGQLSGPALATLRWWSINFAGGALLFFGLPQLLGLLGWDLAFSTVVFLSAVSVHHFFVDGVIWKIRHEGERSPLFSNAAWAWTKAVKNE